MSGSSADNVKISPVNALWRIEAQELIDFTGLTGADVKGGYFNISTAKDAILNYVWGDDSVEADPAPAGRTAIAMTVVGDSDTAATLATACAAAIDGEAGYTAVVSDTTKVLVTRAAVGVVTETADVDMGVGITQCRYGKDLNMGLLNGNVELSLAPANFIVTAHQSGVTPRAALYQGLETAEVGLELLETTDSNLKEVYGVYGTTGFTPGAGTEVYGVGTSKQGENLLPYAARLELKPVNAVDDTQNTTLMLALPVPDTLVFSGEDPKTLSVTFQGYVDDGKDNRISSVLFGDPTQDGL